MTKSNVLEIIDRRISEQYEIIRKYQRGSAHERAQAAKEELFDLRMEIEKIGTKQAEDGDTARK